MSPKKTPRPEEFLDMPISPESGDIVSLVNEIFEDALSLGASDIHIEPGRTYVVLRYRVSGDFIYANKFAQEDYTKILSRIKILANLRIDEKLRPQDGKVWYQSEGNNNEYVDIRVSVIPVVFGEKIVMRILRQDDSRLGLDKLDLMEYNLEKIKKNLASKYGIILIAGPTGSGKSTTLFSMLKHFNPLEHNIATLEDPVEYNIAHMNQTQVRPDIGFDFAAGLRSLMRQDPDIIMVGEMRDKETAMLAIEAALTGHLVFSTIHTNSASGTVQRLTNMGIEPFLISSALKLVISQRLVKRVCSHCSTAVPISDPIKLEKVRELLDSVVDVPIETIPFHQGVGCDKCSQTGYAGRIAVHEVLELSSEFDDLVLTKASVHELQIRARELGMVTVVQDALIKAAQGKTTLDEALHLL